MKDRTPKQHHRVIVGVAAMLLLGLARPALADSSAGGEEYLSVAEAVEPNILFVIDLSMAMNEACPVQPGAPPDQRPSSCLPCIIHVKEAIQDIAQHFDWARYGVVGTTSTADSNTWYPIAPLGSTFAELSARLATVTAWPTSTTRNLSEVLGSLGDSYFQQTAAGDLIDNDGDGILADWTDAPIQYWCQENHIIVITLNRPNDDETPPTALNRTISPDIRCDQENVILTGTDEECLYDNVVGGLYNLDARTLLGTQNVIVHTLSIGQDTNTVAESLFGNAAEQTNGEGIYNIPVSSNQLLSSLMLIMSDIHSGFYTRSSPVLSWEGDFLVYSFYEIIGGVPLAEGHVRGYQIDDDPASATYGQVQYLTGVNPRGGMYEDWGGALWDAGNLLVSRPVNHADLNEHDQDGVNNRDIYTFVDEMMAYGTTRIEGLDDHRMSFDSTFVSAFESAPTGVQNRFFNNIILPASTCVVDRSYDINDDCVVDGTDYQMFVDFVRGLNTSEFRWLDERRGWWKLGDAPHSTPAIVTARNGNFSMDPVYREYITNMEDAQTPSMVYSAANDGMIHAFYLDDIPLAPHLYSGEEAWAWIPSYLLYRNHAAEWTSHLFDLMLYGRTFVFDGSPVVDDVWVDRDGDNSATVDEWYRVLVVQQGQGGPVTLALDVTNPTEPRFLWEQISERDATAQAYTVSQPIIARLYDTRDASAPVHRWVAIWGSGRPIPYTTSTSYYNASEATLFMWGMGDSYWKAPGSSGYAGIGTTGTRFPQGLGARMDQGGSSGHPELGTYTAAILNPDGDIDLEGEPYYEYAYIAATLTVVDVDNDFDAEVVYFPVTTTYGSSDESQSPGTTVQDPGDTWMWKALISASNPGDLEWCPSPFYDPKPSIGFRPEVYYQATASWYANGVLALYWGSGSPYDRDSAQLGYFFAVKDTSPLSCSTGVPITCAGLPGYYPLSAGEGLTSDPIINTGVIYFTTYLPNADRCAMGTGRLYGIRFTDCSPAMDSNGDGVIDSADQAYVEVPGYPSQPVVSEQGTIFVGSSNPITDGTAAAVNTFDAVQDPFMGTAFLSWMELY